MFIKKCFLLLFQLFAFSGLHSQLCKGSLGDPIINITFGAGTNPGGPFSGTSNLSYNGSDCPNDGNYAVRNNTNHCFDNTWHNLNSDHTGDPNGYFMLINAAFQRSEFYNDTVRGLCPNTTYEFAAWIMNILVPSACSGNGIRPNLTFYIETTGGAVLQKYSTGDINTTSNAQWRQYGFFFVTPSNAGEVVVRIINNATGGCGNDLAIDDITFRPCGPELIPYIPGEAGTTKELCEGNSSDVTLSCHVSAGYNSPAYQWQESKDNGITYTNIPGAIDTVFVKSIAANTPVGNYLYRLSAGEGVNTPASCRVASGTLTIHVSSKPVANTRSNSPVCEGSAAVLSASGGSEYNWSGVNGFSASGSTVTVNDVKLDNAGTYYVSVKTAGCTVEDSIDITIIKGPDAEVAFSSRTICEGDSVYLNSSGGNAYFWSPSSGLSSNVVADPVARPSDTTQYTVVVQNETSCKDSASVTINVIARPKAEAGADQYISEGQSVQLLSTAYGSNVSYNWSPGVFINDVHTLQPIVNPVSNINITYFLKVSSNNGCGIATDSVRVHVFKKVIIPSAFSPNNDGINDTWNIKALNAYNDYELSVFNRYGRVIFATKDYSKPWDGTYNNRPLPAGTYYYVLNLNQGLPILKGYVVILR